MATITKENYIVVYRLDDTESKEFAEHYADKHGLSKGDIGVDLGGSNLYEVYGQLVGIPCSDTEILDSEGEFSAEVVIPLQEAVVNSHVFEGRDIWGIVLGYNVPGGFYDPGISALFSSDNPSGTLDSVDIISSTSRVSRALSATGSQSFHDFDKKVANKLYNRSIFKRFDEEDAEHVVVVSRIDAPTLALAKQFADNTDNIIKQGKVEGKFYIDPYSDRAGPAADAYTEALVYFRENFLQKLNLEIFSTTFEDPYIDSTIPYVLDDAFVWSWFADKGTSDFFKETPSIRTFFFNGDNNSAFTVRDTLSDSWSYLALQGGYASVAGTMSIPGYNTYPDPTPFFDALIRGATVGEAFLFSVPNLDWTFTLFGDPLITVAFPDELELKEEEEDILDEDQSWLLLTQDAARISAYLYKKERELNEVRDEVVNINQNVIEQALLYRSNDLYQIHDVDSRRSEIRPLVSAILSYPPKRFKYGGLSQHSPDLNLYLQERGLKISRLLDDVATSQFVEEDNLLEEGYWEFIFEIEDDANLFVNYHFILEVSSDSDFASNIIMSRDSASLLNWSFETEKDNYIPMLISGVPASKVGRRVKYIRRKDTFLNIDESLERAEIYYFRVTQYNYITGEEYIPRVVSDIIYT